MKKVILVLIGICLCSGCSVTYNLDIMGDYFNESTTLATQIDQEERYDDTLVSDFFDITSQDPKLKYFDSGYDLEYFSETISEDELYSVSTNITNGIKSLNLASQFSYLDFYRSNVVKQCFKELSVQNNGEYIMLRTNNKCEVFDEYSLLENITINIITDLEVIVSNADSEDGNTYTWNINRENYTNKPVRITYALNPEDNNASETPTEPDEEKNSENKKEINRKYNILIIIGSFIVLIGVIVGIIKYKKNHN